MYGISLLIHSCINIIELLLNDLEEVVKEANQEELERLEEDVEAMNKYL